jgi:Ca-activated chloride channel homolog
MKNYLLITVFPFILLQACGINSSQSLVEDEGYVSQDAVTVKSEVLSEHKAVKKEWLNASRGKTRHREARAAMPSVYGIGALEQLRAGAEPVNRENYKEYDSGSVKNVAEVPVSTFSIDVDTGSYSNMRRFLNEGRLPDEHSVRVEEMINYFNYSYRRPESKLSPFSLNTEIAPTPWNKNSYLLHVGLQGYEINQKDLPPANLVFLVDVSGSMNNQKKLGLLKSGLKLLVNQLDKNDRVSLVVYAGTSGVVLEPTAANNKSEILTALDRLSAGGSTNGAAGINLAYLMAQQGYIKNGINRVILATDGDFNVGTVNFEALKQLVEKKRKAGVSLTTLGFGAGNYNDHLMEQLADVGNGNYAYIDNMNEARKVLVEQMGATLNTIAKDVKIQIEFNPELISEYRLIGYENRILKREDFNNDKIDAGEIGAGHSVTALYEITLKGSKAVRLPVLRYSNQLLENDITNRNNELAHLSLRYKVPGKNKSKLIQKYLYAKDLVTGKETLSDNFLFSSAVAAFGQKLRGGEYLEEYNYDDILSMARRAKGDDSFGYRGEFIQLVALAKALN